MTAGLYIRTLQWNVVRGLTNKLDLDLENKMLEEEKKEFWDDYFKYQIVTGMDKIDALTGMVDAMCDFTFVAIGTDVKSAMNAVSKEQKVILTSIKDDAQKQIGLMGSLLINEIGNIFDVDTYYEMVVDANDAKPNKQDTEGKNEKGVEWEDPKHKIKAHLLTLPSVKLIAGITEEPSKA